MKFLVNGGFTYLVMNPWHECDLEFHHNNKFGLVHEDKLNWSNVTIGCWDSFDHMIQIIFVVSLEVYKYRCLAIHLEHKVSKKIEIQKYKIK